MNKELTKTLVDVNMGRKKADLCLQNVQIVDVYNKEVFKGDVFIKDGYFCSCGGNDVIKAEKYVDCDGKYLVPGFIDAHCHIESSHLSPSEFSDAVVPRGTTTVIADPHEICNVAGLDGMRYMLSSAKNAPLSIFFMFPSCVPATDFENAGAVLLAEDIEKIIDDERILGLGEMMNYPGLFFNDQKVLDKLETAYKRGKNIDGHSPGIVGNALDAYTAARITTDHECETPEDLHERVRRGVYVMLREGTACKNVLGLLPAVTKENSNRILFCTDDCQPQTITTLGHVSNGIKLAIEHGLDPLYAISMASLNAATCYKLEDRGAIAPGLRADCFLTDSLTKLDPLAVYIKGNLVAENGKILKKTPHAPLVKVAGMMNVKKLDKDIFKLHLKSDHVRVIRILPGGVVTKEEDAYIKRDSEGDFIHDENVDLLKVAVIERHHGTGNVGLALIRGYGMKRGAVATSVAHDSHNIIVVGSSNEEMLLAVQELVKLGGGITVVKDGKLLGSLQHEIAGLMTDKPLDYVKEKLDELHEIAVKEISDKTDIDPFMTLCFMALPVIPEVKVTDLGLFNVSKFKLEPLEID